MTPYNNRAPPGCFSMPIPQMSKAPQWYRSIVGSNIPMHERTCSSCKWYEYQSDGRDRWHICGNTESPFWTKRTNLKDTCRGWSLGVSEHFLPSHKQRTAPQPCQPCQPHNRLEKVITDCNLNIYVEDAWRIYNANPDQFIAMIQASPVLREAINKHGYTAKDIRDAFVFRLFPQHHKVRRITKPFPPDLKAAMLRNFERQYPNRPGEQGYQEYLAWREEQRRRRLQR